MRKRTTRLLSIILFAALLFQGIGLTVATTDPVSAATASQEQGLPENTKDGLMFHAWNWSFDTITNNLPALAAAGFKTVQTSPIQGTKEATMEGSKWWVLYQPTNFKIGNAQLGSRDQFRRMNEEAEKYGISIIVDVVVNHTANAGGGSAQYSPAYNVDSTIRNNPNFWHEARGVEDWNNRWQVTQLGIGLPDLNTSNEQLQDHIIAFLNDAIAMGADGFRFDAAKHIELPNETGGSNFWPRVLGALNNKDQIYIYGEVLQGGADNYAAYTSYMNLTADLYGHNLRSAVGFGGSKNVNGAKTYSAPASASQLITLVETHDSYANDRNESTSMNEWQIKMGWALIGARAATSSLFFNRPAGGAKFAGSLGTAGDNLWKDADIAAVNKFHNEMVGVGEHLRTQGNEIMLIERGTRGMTIVNLGGDAQINSETNLRNGTYTNKASGGGTFTVSNGRITGNISGGKIAVLYETVAPTPTISIDAQEGGFYTDSLNVKISYAGADTASYTVNNGTPTVFHSGTTISLGVGAALGTTFALKVTANNSAGQSTETYTFTKEDPNATLGVHFYKPSNWGTPKLYYYDDSVTPTRIGPAWPGVTMNDEGNGWYVYQIPGWTQGKVIFSSGGNQSPSASQPGYQINGNKWIKDRAIYSQNPDVITPTISIDKSEGVFSSESLDVTISYTNADNATYTLNGSAPVSIASGGKVTIGAGDDYGTQYTLNIIATNADKNVTKTFTFTKDQQQSVTVHYYKPSNWGTPNIYYYDETVTPTRVHAAWPGTAMKDDGNGWYSYTLTGWEKANVIFNSNGQQAPASSQPGYLITQNTWINNGVITHEEPKPIEDQMISVTFNVNQATTVAGQSVYIVGSIAELGNWTVANAIGPGSSANYPNWSITVSLPEGATIQFKAIKKNGTNVVWGNGGNQSYTVSSSNPVVNINF